MIVEKGLIGKPESRVYPHGHKALLEALERNLKNITSKGKPK